MMRKWEVRQHGMIVSRHFSESKAERAATLSNYWYGSGGPLGLDLQAADQFTVHEVESR